MQNLIITTLAVPGKAELDILLLSESLRSFGGNLAECPIWVLVPMELGPLSYATQKKLDQLDARIIALEIDSEIFKFPFATKVLAAAFIENQARGHTERLAYMDRDTIVLGEPVEFLISTDHMLGYRPVHHKLIGSTWDQPLDSFWELIYKVCDVPNEKLFPMLTNTGEQIRPYFNAGVFIIRPDCGLLTHWWNTFLKWYHQPEIKAYYQKDQLYAIFIHQAVFSGVLLHNLEPKEMYRLSSRINYPLHLHDEIPADQRPATIDELVTVRYEQIFDQPGWSQLPITDSLKTWLEAQPRIRTSLEGKVSKNQL